MKKMKVYETSEMSPRDTPSSKTIDKQNFILQDEFLWLIFQDDSIDLSITFDVAISEYPQI